MPFFNKKDSPLPFFLLADKVYATCESHNYVTFGHWEWCYFLNFDIINFLINILSSLFNGQNDIFFSGNGYQP